MVRVLIIAVIASAGVGFFSSGCGQPDVGGSSPDSEPTHQSTTLTTLGIDLGSCPKAEPEELPPNALAGATEAALDQVPSVFGDVKATEGAYAVAAYLGKSGLGRSPIIRKGLECSQLLQDRSVTMDLVFPEFEPSASLSQHRVFVARFRGGYRVWAVGR